MEFTEGGGRGWPGSFDCDIRSELQSEAKRRAESTKEQLSAKTTARKEKTLSSCLQSEREAARAGGTREMKAGREGRSGAGRGGRL